MSITDIVTDTDTDFIDTCMPALIDTRSQIIKIFEHSNLNQASGTIKYPDTRLCWVILTHFLVVTIYTVVDNLP